MMPKAEVSFARQLAIFFLVAGTFLLVRPSSALAYCGDATCDSGETCTSCSADCGSCSSCGDGTCDSDEACLSCSADCGDCDPLCGDGTCNGDETCTSCSADCDDCPCDDPCDQDGDCYNLDECCELEECSDFSCPGYCDGQSGPCEIAYCCSSGQTTGPECSEICDDTIDNDSNGLIDCADTSDGTDGCCTDVSCENEPACNPVVYGCMDECADNFNPAAQEDPNDECTYGGLDNETGCCDDGQDNDGDDGSTNGGTDETDQECTPTCGDSCATNYDPNGPSFCTDDDGDGVDDCCEIPDENGGEIDCCDDSVDNDAPSDRGADVGRMNWCTNDADGDGLCTGIDDEEGDSDCTGGLFDCGPYTGSYSATATCAGAQTSFEGDNEIELFQQMSCPTDNGEALLSAHTVDALASRPGGVCGFYESDEYFAGDSTFSFSFIMTQRDACPNLANSQPNVPRGYTQNQQGDCVVVDCTALGGDTDGDSVCDIDDPCPELADPNLGDGFCAGLPCSALEEVALAGLVSVSDQCLCGEFTRELGVGYLGEDVGALQDYLIANGYLSIAAVPSRGDFNIATRVAVVEMQQASGLAETSGSVGLATLTFLNTATGGPKLSSLDYTQDYSAALGFCPADTFPVEDLCVNLSGNQSQVWLDENPEFTVTGDQCLCGENQKICDIGVPECIPEDECCQPEDFWYCEYTETCITNETCCGPSCEPACPNGVCDVGETYGSCPADCDPTCGNGICDPGENAASCPEDCDGSCSGTCRSGFAFCESQCRCVEDPAECIEGCYPTGAGPDPYAQVSSYCAIVAAETDANADGRGDFYRPWRVGAGLEYSTFAALDAFFGAACNAGFPGGCTAGDLARIFGEQNVARTDGFGQTVTYPVYGVVTRGASGATCEANPCEHGEECGLYVQNGRTVAACIAAACDPCDSSLPACLGVPGENTAGSCCYDPDPLLCCAPGDPACEIIVCTPGAPGCVPLRGVAIEAVPNVINANEECLLVWASQGMASAVVTGPGVDADLADNLAGSDEVSPGSSSAIYKIVGTDPYGETYEATDICAIKPNIREI